MISRFRLLKHVQNLKKQGYLSVDDDNLFPIVHEVDCSFGVSPFGYSKNITPETLFENINFSPYQAFPFNSLKEDIIKFWCDTQKLKRRNITVCSGTNQFLELFTTLFAGKNVKILGYTPQFPEFINTIAIRGGTYVGVPLKKENNYKFDLDDFLDKLNSDEFALVYLDNPNNPTGQIIPISYIEKIAEASNKRNICVIVDEAYGDFMTKHQSAISIIDKYPNVIALRSFSKGYALAGMRVGYVVGSEEIINVYSLIDDLLVNAFGLKAASISLNDHDHLPKTIANTVAVKNKILSVCNKLKYLETNETVPIFTLVHPDDNLNFHKFLLNYGIATSYGFENIGKNAVRVRIPTDPSKLIEKLKLIEESI